MARPCTRNVAMHRRVSGKTNTLVSPNMTSTSWRRGRQTYGDASAKLVAWQRRQLALREMVRNGAAGNNRRTLIFIINGVCLSSSRSGKRRRNGVAKRERNGAYGGIVCDIGRMAKMNLPRAASASISVRKWVAWYLDRALSKWRVEHKRHLAA